MASPAESATGPEKAAAMLSISRTKLYELLAGGAIASVKVGGSRRVPVQAVEAYVTGLLAEEQSR
ncbi:MAG: helix-turn-helix domain-containing protein [Acidimicrobiales bacterium]